MRYRLPAFLTLALIGLAAGPEARAQEEDLHGYEFSVETEAPVTLLLCEGGACGPEATATLIQPSPATPDFCLDLYVGTPDNTGCAEIDISGPDVPLFLLQFSDPSSSNAVAARYAYAAYGDSNANTFYIPEPPALLSGDSPDIRFDVSDETAGLLVKATTGSTHFEDIFTGGHYVLPYEKDAYCALGGSGCNAQGIRGPFLSPLDTSGPLPDLAADPDYTFSVEGDALVHEAWAPTWDLPGLTLRFHQNRGLVVEGRLDTEGVLLTEAVAGQTWRGLAFVTPTGSGATAMPASVLLDSVVEHVGPLTGGRAVAGAVGAFGRDVTLSGTEVRSSAGGVIGLLASGAAAHVLVTDGSLIYENDGGGALAASGASLTIELGSEVRDNPGGGAAATGYGSTLVLDGVTIRDHDGPGTAAAPGVRALNNGQVLFANDASDTRVQVFDNEGGLDAQGGGLLDAGQCQPNDSAPCPGRNVHEIKRNAPGGAFFDARSQNGSTLFAQGNDWDVTDVDLLVLVEDGSSVLEVCPIIGDDCGTPQRLAGSGALPAGGTFGRGSGDVLALVEEAERAHLAGDAAAFELAADAVVAALASEDGDDRRAAFEATTRLFAWEQPAGPLASLVTLSGQEGDGRPWALRALGVARASAEGYADARAAADTLAAAYAGSEHARFGLGLAVRVAVAEEDEAAAVAALVALASAFPEADEVGVLAALVLGAFPEADLSGLEGGSSAPAATASAGAETPAALLRMEAARPNPAAATATVPFALTAAADVEAALYDGLGRRVAVLASGRYGAGAHALVLVGSALPAGVYVVHVTARGGSGTATAVRRITLAR